MVPDIVLLLGTIVTLLFVLSWAKSRRGKDEPPGPFAWPILGNFVQIFATGELKESIKAFHKLAQKFGPIMSLQLGSMQTIMISNYEVYKEIMVRDDLGSRASIGGILDRQYGNPDLGIIVSNGVPWQTMRRWTIRTLRDFGFGKRIPQSTFIELEVRDQIDHIVNLARSNNGILQVDTLFNLSTVNVLWSMVAGYRYNLDDPKLLYLMKITSEMVRALNFTTRIQVAFPWTRIIFPELTGRNKVIHVANLTRDFMIKQLHEHQERHDHRSNPQCVIDAFSLEMENERLKVSGAKPLFTEDNFVMLMSDLFQAGADTSSAVLTFALLHMISFPHVQVKVQEELDSVVPRGTVVGLQYKDKLPYTNATILEIIRFGSPVPVQINRLVENDFYFQGFKFGKGKMILPNVYSNFNDVGFWGDPQTFRPERFLSENGTELLKDKCERITPFGLGMRICPGKQLAENVVFTFFATIIQTLNFELVPNQPKPTLVPREGSVVSPFPFDTIVTQRF